MTIFLTRTVTLVPALFIATVIGWTLTYPSESDPKNIKYLLWKSDLYGMKLNAAVGTMIGDGSSEKLVVGKTRAQLGKKFGYLSTPSDMSPYLRACYQGSAWQDKDVLFIRKSSWMAIFNGDKATNLVSIKAVSSTQTAVSCAQRSDGKLTHL